MDRAATLELLEMVRRHLATGERLVARQHEIVAELERGDHDSSYAKAVLASFKETQKLHIADRDRLEKELAGKPRR
jgi:hypothetical protein